MLARKFKALQVEEASLGQSHAEESRLCQELANARTSLMTEEAKTPALPRTSPQELANARTSPHSLMTELARMRNKAELDATSQCLADERMTNKDAMDRLRLELAEARATIDELQRSLHGKGEENGSLEGKSANGAT